MVAIIYIVLYKIQFSDKYKSEGGGSYFVSAIPIEFILFNRIVLI